MSRAVFEKHDYSKQEKRRIQLVDNYDPRPPEFRGTASERMPELLEAIRGNHLCMSLLFDEKCRYWNAEEIQSSSHSIPTDTNLHATMSAFKESQCISEAEAREIEQNT